MNQIELLEMAIKFHGHKCPAMPLGLRAGWVAMEKLGVERASNKELFCYLETGPAHAMMCFGDGVQVATGCTYGKGNIEKLNYSKIGIILIDVKNKKAVRVNINPEFHKMAIGSQFVQMRKNGIEPKDIAPEIIDPLVEKVMQASDGKLFKISNVFNFDFKPTKSTFELHECEKCGETVFATAIRIVDGKTLCLPCSEYEKAPAV